MTQDYLKSILDYDEQSGLFTWKYKTGSKGAGSIAGSNHRGYIEIGIKYGGKKKKYQAHRLAFIITGYELSDDEFVDHINHCRSDNRLCNLRIVDRTGNARNITKPKNNTTGQVGVNWRKDMCKWQAVITVDYKKIHLGTFAEYHEAVNARKNAEVLYGFHENHGS